MVLAGGGKANEGAATGAPAPRAGSARIPGEMGHAANACAASRPPAFQTTDLVRQRKAGVARHRFCARFGRAPS
ncbi:hypothetical protein SAMN05444370_101392 [Rubrimonas cliftonensis]|uniref:Uncharacterized protein n=1 Tax=Rubrimonas cliftonensis TaxID=89524 RepID=A0A1H3VXQ3_9RHOB|nr:hypothetical protein SAMN05444370_101392 [Rubrimonas cliftonensis]